MQNSKLPGRQQKHVSLAGCSCDRGSAGGLGAGQAGQRNLAKSATADHVQAASTDAAEPHKLDCQASAKCLRQTYGLLSGSGARLGPRHDSRQHHGGTPESSAMLSANARQAFTISLYTGGQMRQTLRTKWSDSTPVQKPEVCRKRACKHGMPQRLAPSSLCLALTCAVSERRASGSSACCTPRSQCHDARARKQRTKTCKRLI